MLKYSGNFDFEFNAIELEAIKNAISSRIEMLKSNLTSIKDEDELLRLKAVYNKVINEIQILTGNLKAE